jgi:hypothetical protein
MCLIKDTNKDALIQTRMYIYIYIYIYILVGLGDNKCGWIPFALYTCVSTYVYLWIHAHTDGVYDVQLARYVNIA